MRLYRVFPFEPSAPLMDPGGALFAPRSAAGRIANLDLYSELYFSSTTAAALSEAFGRLDTWTASMLVRDGRPYALAEFQLSDNTRICNLDNAARLLSYDLMPSDVVASDRSVTQAWAARIYGARKWSGISWWSRYESRWQSIGLWQRKGLRLHKSPEILSLDSAAVHEEATLLPRRLSN